MIFKRLPFYFLLLYAFLLQAQNPFSKQTKFINLNDGIFTKETKYTNQNLKSPLTYDFSNFTPDSLRDIPGMKGISPSGDVINVTNQFITLNEVPWIPTFGEFEFSRYPPEHWEDAILKMKSAGFYGISCYVLWLVHEEIEKEWNWEGRADFRGFLELCKKHNMGVYARIGPWVNGEIRNGGHPDWLVKRLGDSNDPFGHIGSGGKLRTTDPEYIAAVDKFYFQLSKQMKGMYWKDGGPIFAIQLDNENTPGHKTSGVELLKVEKEMALKYGMIVPIYSSTAWDKAEFIQDHTLPSYGSYADYFWGSANSFYRTPAFSFSTQRAVNEINTQVNPVSGKKEKPNLQRYENNPYMTCETGVGMNMAYHRRTLVTPKDNGAISLVELGSGCNAMGYFMFLGGNNPIGKYNYTNRELEKGGIDNAIISNDFQSAIGEFGQIRESFYEYPAQLNFMADFGHYLAPCTTFVPKELDELFGADINNSKLLQHTVRTDGNTGFLFVNNQIKNDTLYQFDNVQFKIKLKNETLVFPKKTISVSAHNYFYWPFNLTISDVTLKYATAQPAMYLKKSNTYVFFKNEGIPAEFSLDNKNITDIKAVGAKVTKENNRFFITIENPGLNCYADIQLANGKTTRILVLNEKQAKQMYKYNDTLYLSDTEVVLFNHNQLEVISEKTTNSLWMYPNNTLKNNTSKTDGIFEKININFEKKTVSFEYETIQDGKNIQIKNTEHAVSHNIGVPNESVFDKGTKVGLKFPQGIPNQLYDVRINVDYVGSALHFYKNDKLAYDNYFNGTSWVLSAKHQLQDYNQNMKLELKVIPLQANDPIYIGGVFWPDHKKTENTLDIKKIKAIPVYSTTLSIQ